MKKSINKNQIVDGMLWCSFHKKMEPVGEFGDNRARKNGKAHYCKLAARETWKIRMKNTKTTREHDKLWRVYRLPCGYIGQTKSLKRRFRCHRRKGRITEGYEIMTTARNLTDARKYECWLQALSPHYKFQPDAPKYLKQ